MEDRIIDIVDKFGYVGIAGLVALETIFPPIPSELILPLAGFLSGQGELSLWGVMLCATLGSVAGALLLYLFARWFGSDGLRAAGRYGKYLLLEMATTSAPRAGSTAHSNKAVLFGRLVPACARSSHCQLASPRCRWGHSCSTPPSAAPSGTARWSALAGRSGIAGIRSAAWSRYLQYAVIAVILLAIIWFAWSRRDTWRVWATRRGN